MLDATVVKRPTTIASEFDVMIGAKGNPRVEMAQKRQGEAENFDPAKHGGEKAKVVRSVSLRERYCEGCLQT